MKFENTKLPNHPEIRKAFEFAAKQHGATESTLRIAVRAGEIMAETPNPDPHMVAATLLVSSPNSAGFGFHSKTVAYVNAYREFQKTPSPGAQHADGVAMNLAFLAGLYTLYAVNATRANVSQAELATLKPLYNQTDMPQVQNYVDITRAHAPHVAGAFDIARANLKIAMDATAHKIVPQQPPAPKGPKRRRF